MPSPQPPRDSIRERLAHGTASQASHRTHVGLAPLAKAAVGITGAQRAQGHTLTVDENASFDGERAGSSSARDASYVHPTYDTLRRVPVAHNEVLPAAPAQMDSSRWVVDPEIAAAWQTPDMHERTYHEGAWKPDTSTLRPGDTLPVPPSRWSLHIVRASRADSGELEAAIGPHFRARISRLTVGVASGIAVMLFVIAFLMYAA